MASECYGWKDLLNYAGAAGNFVPGQCSYFGGSPVLPQAIGWIIVIAFGGGEAPRVPAGQAWSRCRRTARPHARVARIIRFSAFCCVGPAAAARRTQPRRPCSPLLTMSAALPCLPAAALRPAVFTLFTSLALWLDSRFTAAAGTSEAYTTAGRAVKAGLTACDIVSECTQQPARARLPPALHCTHTLALLWY